jgi:predicted amidophosphoribosyltransferase
VLALVLPTHCVGCGAGGPPLCGPCALPLAGPARRHAPTPAPAGLPPLWATAAYTGAVRSAVVAYKDRGRRDLCRFLTVALLLAVRAAAGGPVALVPVPSRRAAARRRGGDHVALLARRVARSLGGGAVVCPALRPVGSARDAAGLSASERLASRRAAFGVRSGWARWLAGGRTVVLVDDLVTTGATLAGAAAALRRGGVEVAAAAVIAATLRNQRQPLF